MLKKVPATTVLILLILLSISPLVGSADINTSNTIYVDDNNTLGPWDGSLAYPYQFIQEGINASSDGDTVFVFNGLYNESLWIRESIILEGEDQNNTIICVNDYVEVITINAREVKVTGFTLMHTDAYQPDQYSQGIYLDYNAHECIIEGNIITKCNIAIYSWGCKNIIIQNNVLTHNDGGLWARGDNGLSRNTFANNFISSNDFGAILTGNGDEFYNNTVCNNAREGIDVGFFKNHVYQNEIYKNGAGVVSYQGFFTRIEHNVIRNNSGDGIRLSGIFNLVTSNTISGNNGYPIFVTYDTNPLNYIDMIGFGNTISRNNIIDNELDTSFDLAFFTHWNRNYWGTESHLPHLIHDRTLLPRINIDWFPATEPYSINYRGQE